MPFAYIDAFALNTVENLCYPGLHKNAFLPE